MIFTVPEVNAKDTQIDRLRTNEAVKNLGLYACPDGSSEHHFEEIRKKIMTWTSQIQNRVLPTRSVWMSYTHQLWAGLWYGLGACSASMTALIRGLGSADYYLLSNLGVVRSITRELTKETQLSLGTDSVLLWNLGIPHMYMKIQIERQVRVRCNGPKWPILEGNTHIITEKNNLTLYND
jgi:hypothetical protein